MDDFYIQCQLIIGPAQPLPPPLWACGIHLVYFIANISEERTVYEILYSKSFFNNLS